MKEKERQKEKEKQGETNLNHHPSQDWDPLHLQPHSCQPQSNDPTITNEEKHHDIPRGSSIVREPKDRSNKKAMRLIAQLIKFYKFYYLLYLNKRWLNSKIYVICIFDFLKILRTCCISNNI